MSHYGTTADYVKGYDDGADETAALYDDLIAACDHLLERWAKNQNLAVPGQNIGKELKRLKTCRRLNMEC